MLGPILFLIYISDIGEGLTAQTLVYVDDTKIKQKVNTEEDVENLQKELEKLDKWAKSNNMNFNGTLTLTTPLSKADRVGSVKNNKKNTHFLISPTTLCHFAPRQKILIFFLKTRTQSVLKMLIAIAIAEKILEFPRIAKN